MTISTSNGSTLDLGGNNSTIAGLLSNVVGSATTGGTVTNSGAANSTLNVAMVNGNTATFAGVIRNGASKTALATSGSGEQFLSGANTYTGNTTISGGGTLGWERPVPSTPAR